MKSPLTNPDRPSAKQTRFPGNYSEASFSLNDQITYLTLMALASLTLIMARFLHPSSSGVGTHQQLGLPPCLFLKLTGIPCPACGLTTSFAHAARFDFYQAFITQPFGAVAFCLTVIGIPVIIFLLYRRVTWTDVVHARGVDALLYLLTAIFVLSWFYKIALMKLFSLG